MFDFDADDGSADNRRCATVVSPTSATDNPRVQTMPGDHFDGAVTRVGGDQSLIGLPLGSPIRTLEPPSVPRGTSAGLCRSVWTRGRICVKDAVVADTSETFAPLFGQIVTYGDRVVAGVEDEQRGFALAWEESNEASDLF